MSCNSDSLASIYSPFLYHSGLNTNTMSFSIWTKNNLPAFQSAPTNVPLIFFQWNFIFHPITPGYNIWKLLLLWLETFNGFLKTLPTKNVQSYIQKNIHSSSISNVGRALCSVIVNFRSGVNLWRQILERLWRDNWPSNVRNWGAEVIK